MPNRIIKESICTSDNLDTLSWFEEVFFYRLIVNCDDYGRMDARPAILKARLFPLKSITEKQINVVLQSLRSAGMIDLYTVDGRSFLQIRTWEQHQTIRAKKSKFPKPEQRLQTSEINCMQMQADVSVIQSNPNTNPNTLSDESVTPAHAKKRKHGEYGRVLLTEEEYEKLNKEYSNADEAIAFLDEYIEYKGYKAKSHYLAIKKWVFKALEERSSNRISAENRGSFDTDEFIELAMKKSYGSAYKAQNTEK